MHRNGQKREIDEREVVDRTDLEFQYMHIWCFGSKG